MNKFLKYSFYLLAFLIAPWLLLYTGLFVANIFLNSDAENTLRMLQSVGNWNGLLVIGLLVSGTILFYWQDFVFWFAKNKVKTSWTDDAIRKLAKHSHLPVILIVSIHIIFILWQ
ncbi:hypothetical protein [Pseudoalteromonas sp. HM-SA03]|uniref:hypothetical protein n=1 Tax=Pseudoalteromonas sp. HM-SA03 TaxID=2029678 RepID=UPI001140FDD0|nr:hypothetical protein [Pseudoalteromonas sp. HM-SA03]